MINLPLTQKHIDLGARMVDFAGFNMPISYSGLVEEHNTVRQNVGIFDVSHMGEFIVKGKEALEFVQSVCSNDASKLKIGQAQYSCIPNDQGGIVDDLLIYRLAEDMCGEGEKAFMLVVNAGNIKKDWNWLSEKHAHDCRLIDISGQTGLLAVQGPNATKVLQKLCDHPLDDIAFYHFEKLNFAKCENVIVSATGYTGAGGFEIYSDVKDIEKIWDAVLEAGKEYDLLPVGLGARDTLRLEMGYCLYGNDIEDHTSPIEAGLSWITKVNKSVAFSSQEIFKKQKAEGVEKKLVGFIVDERRVPRKDYEIHIQEGRQIGLVTSGTYSPSLNVPIGMGYVQIEYANEDQDILIKTGRKYLPAKVVKVPFYKD